MTQQRALQHPDGASSTAAEHSIAVIAADGRKPLPARCVVCRSTMDVTMTTPNEFLRNTGCARCGCYEIDPVWLAALRADDTGRLRRAVYAYVAEQCDGLVAEISVRYLGAPTAFLPVTPEFT